jgi:hypothetical protein
MDYTVVWSGDALDDIDALAAVTVRIENNRYEVITVMVNFEAPK